MEESPIIDVRSTKDQIRVYISELQARGVQIPTSIVVPYNPLPNDPYALQVIEEKLRNLISLQQDYPVVDQPTSKSSSILPLAILLGLMFLA